MPVLASEAMRGLSHDMLVRAWKHLALEDKEEAIAPPTAVASAPPPPTAVASSKFLALRVIYGNPSTKELASALDQPKPTASSNPTASSSSSSGACLQHAVSSSSSSSATPLSSASPRLAAVSQASLL
eukprot:5858181-Amphidinium_carterae.1